MIRLGLVRREGVDFAAVIEIARLVNEARVRAENLLESTSNEESKFHLKCVIASLISSSVSLSGSVYDIA